ncbi:MAG: hypothetical protein VX829_11505 [Pseudomonadota bacterium]|uniref:hypothetical protein n=1 Tax=Methylophaga sp. TaxID=2024840 RepID=UPI002EA03B7A|nr:hypothetical protein [Pseudomonadota bacterium]
MNVIKAEISKASSESRLVEYLTEVKPDNLDEVVEVLVELNNNGTLNLVENMMEADISIAHQFFWVCYIFEKALPKLQSHELKTIKCILHLLEHAGEDLAAGQIVTAYEAYCAVDGDRAKSALRFILVDNSLSSLLAPTLVSGSIVDCDYFWNKTKNLINNDSTIVRANAIRALGRIIYPENNDLILKSFQLIEHHAKQEKDDSCLANILDAIQHLSKHSVVSDLRVTEAFKQALSLKGELTLHAAAELINYQYKSLPKAAVSLMLDSFKSIPLKNTGTFRHVDFGLSKIICDDSFYNESVTLLEVLISNADDSFSFDRVFQHTSRVLLNDSGAFFTSLMTKWFLTANRRYCTSIQQIIASGIYNNKYLINTLDCDGLNEVDYVFLARKAIGYLFMHPVTATGYILALVIRTSSDHCKMTLMSLVYEMLQLNYPGEVGNYLRTQTEPKKIKIACDQILMWSENYFKNIREMEHLPELLPSQAHREAYDRNFSSKMRVSMKSAESESTFLSMVSKSIILYGRKSIDYFHVGEGTTTRRTECHLQRHETGIEVPRQTLIDPVGLDYMLRVFRNEYKIL